MLLGPIGHEREGSTSNVMTAVTSVSPTTSVTDNHFHLSNLNSLPPGFFFPLTPQFFDRLKLVGMPAKHQPDFIYLRHVPLRKVHLFTVTQLSCLVLLWVIKTSRAAIIFPMMVSRLLPTSTRLIAVLGETCLHPSPAGAGSGFHP